MRGQPASRPGPSASGAELSRALGAGGRAGGADADPAGWVAQVRSRSHPRRLCPVAGAGARGGLGRGEEPAPHRARRGEYWRCAAAGWGTGWGCASGGAAAARTGWITGASSPPSSPGPGSRSWRDETLLLGSPRRDPAAPCCSSLPHDRTLALQVQRLALGAAEATLFRCPTPPLPAVDPRLRPRGGVRDHHPRAAPAAAGQHQPRTPRWPTRSAGPRCRPCAPITATDRSPAANGPTWPSTSRWWAAGLTGAIAPPATASTSPAAGGGVLPGEAAPRATSWPPAAARRACDLVRRASCNGFHLVFGPRGRPMNARLHLTWLVIVLLLLGSFTGVGILPPRSPRARCWYHHRRRGMSPLGQDQLQRPHHPAAARSRTAASASTACPWPLPRECAGPRLRVAVARGDGGGARGPGRDGHRLRPRARSPGSTSPSTSASSPRASRCGSASAARS
jgi:hypothetical protein